MRKTFALETVLQEIVIGPCRLILGDAVEALARLEGEADLLVTDPPYKLTSGGKGGGSMSGKFSADRYDNSGELMRMISWEEMAGPMLRACKEPSDAYIMANDKNIFQARNAFMGAGFRYHNLLVWDKGSPTRNRWYMKELEYVLYLYRGKAKTINNPGSKQRLALPRPKIDWHPTAKPVELFEHYILNSSQPGDLVLDPFSGSGACAVAAMRTGRRAVAVEACPIYFEKSVLRLEMEWRNIAPVIASIAGTQMR